MNNVAGPDIVATDPSISVATERNHLNFVRTPDGKSGQDVVAWN